MKIYSIHSATHGELFNLMKHSLMESGMNYELNNKITKQVSETGEYGADDIINFWYLKVLYILELLFLETEPFLYTDTDVYFLRDCEADLNKHLEGKDIAIQYEKHLFGLFPMVCAGFMYMRPNDRTRKMFIWILKNMKRFGNDQAALNRYIYTHRIDLAILPKEYYSINYDTHNKRWEGQEVKVTVKNPFLIHLHWTIGNENRVNLLNYISEQL